MALRRHVPVRDANARLPSCQTLKIARPLCTHHCHAPKTCCWHLPGFDGAGDRAVKKAARETGTCRSISCLHTSLRSSLPSPITCLVGSLPVEKRLLQVMRGLVDPGGPGSAKICAASKYQQAASSCFSDSASWPRSNASDPRLLDAPPAACTCSHRARALLNCPCLASSSAGRCKLCAASSCCPSWQATSNASTQRAEACAVSPSLAESSPTRRHSAFFCRESVGNSNTVWLCCNARSACSRDACTQANPAKISGTRRPSFWQSRSACSHSLKLVRKARRCRSPVPRPHRARMRTPGSFIRRLSSDCTQRVSQPNASSCCPARHA